MNEKSKLDKLLKLAQENPDLPIVPMVDYEVSVGGDEYCRYMGSFGDIFIADYCVLSERVFYRNDNDISEIEDAAVVGYGYDAYMEMSDDEVKDVYAAFPWTKAIIVNIDTV